MAARYESDSDDSIPEIDISLRVNVQPYQYEPVVLCDSSPLPENDSESEISEDQSDECPSPSDMQWCLCGNCIAMPTRRESKCCHAFSTIVPRLEEMGVSCITDHGGFVANCLNRWVLETLYYEYFQDNGPLEEGELIHRVYRHLAYRRFVRWIWQRLEKKKQPESFFILCCD
ncbi:uncharacterized protein LOC125664129 [Ostrea edulis]|uniref:uncharacterized protein LOC125664129 n=1 Tax=Ostrea edulis TaxID=37623 RepID=UPI0024AF4F88|nr:uncharacterized protein LOC125664129 [Ostrea edulis]